jgi:membrane peptidoglycan carboxypeptidase
VASVQKQTLLAAGGNKKAAAQLHIGLASVDNATGGVVALYGGPDFLKSQWNWASNPRPTGSSFKPYALAAALDNGWTLSDKLNGNSFMVDGKVVTNADGNHGRVTLQNATTHSINSAFVDLVRQIPDGPEKVQQMAEAAGVPADGHWDLSVRIPLGNTEVSPVNQANSYATFANNGVHHNAHVVAEVTDSDGASRYHADTGGTETIDPEVANDVSYALTKVTQDGTGYRAAQLGYPVAGKTGTVGYPVKVTTKVGGRTYTHIERQTRAVWFVGYTKQISTAVVMVKGKQGTSDLGHVFGSGFPLSTWLGYMTVAMDGKDRLAFDPPTRRHSTQKPEPKPTHSATSTPTSTPTPTSTDSPTTDPTTDPTSTPTATTEPTKTTEPNPSDPPSKAP